MLPREGYQLERQANYAVALKLDLDDELRREGVAREVVHAVQNARKGAGLQVEDRIELALSGDDDAARRRARARRLRRRRDARRAACTFDGARAEGAHTETRPDRRLRARDRAAARRLDARLAAVRLPARRLRLRVTVRSGAGERDVLRRRGSRAPPRSPTQISSVRITTAEMIGTATNSPTIPNSCPTTSTPIAITRRVQARRARHHERDDHVALDLLDEHVDDQHRERLAGRVGEREQHRRDRARRSRRSRAPPPAARSGPRTRSRSPAR